MKNELPVFPLNTVLFPGCELSLRVFEMRYRRLVDECGRQKPFVIVRIRQGKEVGEPAFTFDTGTQAYFEQIKNQADGTLSVMVGGKQRVQLSNWRVEEDGLMFAEVEPLAADDEVAIPTEWRQFAVALQEMGDSVPHLSTLVWRLASVLPLSLEAKQTLLEMNDVEQRAAFLQEQMKQFPDAMLA
jgi:hypothetical protein